MFNISTPRIALLALAAASVALLPEMAFAEDSLASVEGTANQVLRFMTGPIATAAGAIAIAVTGYRWFSGRMEMGRAVAIVAGIVLVLGSVQIVGLIRQGTGVAGGVDAAGGGAGGMASIQSPVVTDFASLPTRIAGIETPAYT